MVVLPTDIPVLKGSKAKEFIEKVNNPKPVKVTEQQVSIYIQFNKRKSK